MERYEIGVAAERAGTTVEELQQLVDLGILQPDADGRFSDGDVRRVGVIHGLTASSIPVDLVASALGSHDFSLDFVDDPSYSLFASYSNETFEDVSARTGIPLNLLTTMREATGSATPDPGSRIREDELAIVAAIEYQLSRGFREIAVERHVRVIGDSMRRVAESAGDVWRSEVMDPLLAAGYNAEQIGPNPTRHHGRGHHSTTRPCSPSTAHSRRTPGWPTSSEPPRARWYGPGCAIASIGCRPCASSTSPATRG